MMNTDNPNAEKEVASRSIQVQSKRFYLDVKQNRRGRFLKIAEIAATGQKNRIMMSMSSTTEFRDKLTELLKDLNASAGSGGGGGASGSSSAPAAGDVKLRSETLVRQGRRFFLDLKENRRGRYLRVAQQEALTGARAQIAVPAEGVAEMRDRLDELIAECGTEDLADGVEQLPEARSLRAGNKMLYFDVGFNRRGTYLRVSEVRPDSRTAVTLPEKCWPALRDIIAEYIDKTSASGGGGGSKDAGKPAEDGDGTSDDGDAESNAAGEAASST